MTKPSIIALTLFVWTAAFAATGALTYTLTRPLPNAPTLTSAIIAAPPSRARVAPPPIAVETERTIVLPTVVLIGQPIRPAQAKVIKSELGATDSAVAQASTHHCSDWRPLEQGSSSVQICD